MAISDRNTAAITGCPLVVVVSRVVGEVLLIVMYNVDG